MQKAAGRIAWTLLAVIAIACGGIGSAPGYDPAQWATHDPARADLVGTWTIAPLDEKAALDVWRTTSVPVELELRDDGTALIRWRRLLQDIIGSGAWADLKAGKNEMEIKRPLLGIVWNQTSTKEGVEIESITAGHAAEKAGIKPKDVIVEFDGRKLITFDDLKETIMKRTPGDKVKVKVLRGEEEMEFECTLGWDYER